MTRSDDELLHDALLEDAGRAAPPADGFDAVRAEAARRTRRRRWLVAGSAGGIAAVIALVVGIAVASDDDPSTVELTPPETTSSAPSTTTSTTVPESTTIAPETTTTLEVVPTTPPTDTLPPPSGFAGLTEFRTIFLDRLGPPFHTQADSPHTYVDALVAALRAEPIEGRRDALGVVNAVQGNRAQVEVRVIGFADDSVGGEDYRLHLLQEPGQRWSLVAAEVRSLCIRGSDGTLCV
jgi:hypothetical protein